MAKFQNQKEKGHYALLMGDRCTCGNKATVSVWGKLTHRLFANVDVRTIEHSQKWTKHGRR